jgi:hypothetical protein
MPDIAAACIVSDPDTIWPVDPDSGSGSGSRRAKMIHKKRKNLRNFIFLIAGCSLWRLKASPVAWTWFREA